MAKAQVRITREIVADCDGDGSYLEQEGFEERLAAYRNGDFGFVGVRAKAEISVPYGADFIVTHISSPGLWSIENDSGDDYFEEVFKEERAQLIEMLESLRDYALVEGEG